MYKLDDWADDFLLYGIKSRILSEHEFVYQLNKECDVRFERIEDLDVKIEDEIYCFSMFLYVNEVEQLEYYLIQNKAHPKKKEATTTLFDEILESPALISTREKFDYLLKVNSDNTENVEITLSLDLVKAIRLFQPIENLKKTEKQKLIF